MERSILQNRLQQGLQALHLTVNDFQKNQMLAYIELLLKWNKAYNLVATQDAEEILIAHLLDSLSIAPFIQEGSVIDVGSGAGFPGVPLAILFPQYSFTLLDSIGKKVHFLNQVKIELALKNVTVIQGRSELFQPQEGYQQVVARAVGSVEELIKKTQHLLVPSGKILLMKGQVPEAELQNLSQAHEVFSLTVPYLLKERHLIVISL